MKLSRRSTLGLFGAAASGLLLPRSLMASTNRPSITIAVQQITNTGTLDAWYDASNVGERTFYPNFWENLVGRNWVGDQGPVEALATAVRRIDDRTLELDLRQGVRFHNGDEMTSDDVVFSFSQERLFLNQHPQGGEILNAVDFKPTPEKELPPSVPLNGRMVWPGLRGVEAVGRYTVRLHNATPDITLEARLMANSAITSRRAYQEAPSYAEWARMPITTGPYRVVKHEPNVEVVFEAFDDYWEGAPPLKQIRIVEVPEVSSRVNGLLSGEYDFACDLPPDQASILSGREDFVFAGSPITNHRLMNFIKTNPTIEDPLIRRAMTHAIDRQLIVDALWAGMTKIPDGLQFDFYGDMKISPWSVPEYNPTLAKELLAKSNYKGDAIPYRVLNNYYTNQVATAQALTEMFAQVGLNVELMMVENWAQVNDVEAHRGVRDWSNSAVFADPVASIVRQHGPNGAQQRAKEWENAEANALCNKMETSMDRAERKRIFARLLEIMEREDPAFTVLHQNAVYTGMRKSLNFRLSPAFAMDFRSHNWRG